MNIIKTALDKNRKLVGALLSNPTPALVEMCGHAGFDWVFVDGEHEPIGVHNIHDLCRAATAMNIGIMARTPLNDYSMAAAFADAGADAVLMPHIGTRHSAEELVAALRYPPAGRRGFHSGTRAANYGLTHTSAEYFTTDALHPAPAAMIEDVEGIEAMEELVKVDGLRLYVLGPGDLSGSMGYPGQMNHPEVLTAIQRAVETLRSHGKTIVMLAPTPEDADEAFRMGAAMTMAPVGRLVGKALIDYRQAVTDA